MSEESVSRWTTLRRWVGRLGPWLLLIGAAVYLFRTVYPPVELEVIRPVPDFEAPTLRGEPFQMAAHRGEIVVVNVWATWCPPCRLEVPGFVELQEQFRDDGVVFVGLNVDEEGLGAIQSFVDEYGVNYPQVDGRRVVYRHFPGDAIPRTYLIDRQGRIRFAHTGFLMKKALKKGIEALLAEEPYRSPSAIDGSSPARPGRRAASHSLKPIRLNAW